MRRKDTVRLTFDVSPELYDCLGDMAERMGTTKAEVLRKAIALMEIAIGAQARGENICLSDSDDRVVVRIRLA